MASPIKKMAIETPGGDYQEKKIGADAEDITVYKDSDTNTYINNIEEYSGDPVVTSLPITLNDLNNKTIDENHGGIGTRGINSTSGGVQNSQAVTTAGALYSTTQSLRNSFQVGVDTIYNAIVNNGVTPASSTPTDCAAGIDSIRTPIQNAWVGAGTPTSTVAVKVPIPAGYHNGKGYVTCNGNTAYQNGYNAAKAETWTKDVVIVAYGTRTGAAASAKYDATNLVSIQVLSINGSAFLNPTFSGISIIGGYQMSVNDTYTNFEDMGVLDSDGSKRITVGVMTYESEASVTLRFTYKRGSIR